jgi:hypothetical protein
MVLVMLTDDRIMLLARRRTGLTVELSSAHDPELSAVEDAPPPIASFS